MCFWLGSEEKIGPVCCANGSDRRARRRMNIHCHSSNPWWPTSIWVNVGVSAKQQRAAWRLGGTPLDAQAHVKRRNGRMKLPRAPYSTCWQQWCANPSNQWACVMERVHPLSAELLRENSGRQALAPGRTDTQHGMLTLALGWPPAAQDPQGDREEHYNWIVHQLQVGTSFGRWHNWVQFQIWYQFWIPRSRLHRAMYLIF